MKRKSYAVKYNILNINKGRSWKAIPFRSRNRNYMGGFTMARQKTVTVNNVDYKLQSVNFTWYTNLTDLYVNPVRGRKNSAKYADSLIKGCVVEPAEVAREGLKFFDDRDDIATPSELVNEIETFLAERV